MTDLPVVLAFVRRYPGCTVDAICKYEPIVDSPFSRPQSDLSKLENWMLVAAVDKGRGSWLFRDPYARYYPVPGQDQFTLYRRWEYMYLEKRRRLHRWLARRRGAQAEKIHEATAKRSQWTPKQTRSVLEQLVRLGLAKQEEDRYVALPVQAATHFLQPPGLS